MHTLKISVVIPVYNAEKYLQNAVLSAVGLPEVGEIILVEDASPDNALQLCRQLEKEHPNIKLYRHPGGENRGAGASRNLGIKMAGCDYIAFLDADDWFLPNRFEAERDLLNDKMVDGVYGATGYYFEKEKKQTEDLTTLPVKLKPSQLLEHLLFKKGHFHLNALTVKKSKLLEVGGFNTELRLHQDTHLSFKLAHLSNLYPGKIKEAVAVRRVHDENRINSINLKTKSQLRTAVYKTFSKYNDIDPDVFNKIRKEYLRLKYFRRFYEFKIFLTENLNRKKLFR